ncbi:hypothetical protein SPBR_02217 [Sporothrix brasiliensis 5110]|uniref:Major facilitator superfamily (MFS) profile domain-containing protein n=1 Tax=Sporothrix brasiliensis 5110 TaxID=1398154 RepID=A0A0C2J232_9PEZI|nr:uncharacterized protein SPBR_02217 [Sporothrix brasiliensis 5110]KIH93075.1 hypothetical protein SPBR_02217 [Sporothrix brasiliensis 5110]
MANGGNDHADRLHPGAGTGAATGSATGSSSELSPPSTAGLAGSTQAGEPSPRSVLDNVDEKSESTRPDDKATSRDAARTFMPSDAAKNKDVHTSHDSHDSHDDSDGSSDGDAEDTGRRNDPGDAHREHPDDDDEDDDDDTPPMANEPGAGLQALEVQMSQQANERPASLSLARTVSRAPTIIPRSKRRGLFGQFAILPEVERPYEYRNKTKWLITLIVALTAAGGPLGSSILYPALASLTVDLHTSPTTANLNVALYMLAMGIFPLWWSSFSETLGRRTIYIISFCLFVVFSILSAISKSIGMLIVMRVLAGGASASVQAVGAGTLADIWEPRERGRAMGIFYLGPLTGPLFAPIIGGALAEKWGWESTMWFLTIYGGLAFVMLFFCLPETLARDRRPPRELEKTEKTEKQEKKNKPPQTQTQTQADVEGQATSMAEGEAAESGAAVAPALARMTTTQSVRVQTQRVGSFLKVAFVQPLSVLLYLRFPPILLTVVYGSVTFGSLFVLNVSIQSAFAKPPYQFSELIVGLLYIPSSLGYILASLVGGRWIDNIMAREARKAGRYDAQGRLVFLPEDRMRENAWLSASLFPAALVWFGWTAQHGVYWIVPSIANFVFGFGSMLVFGAVTTMLTEFMPRRSSGGIALNNFLRNIFSCVGAIVAQPLIGAMGYGWLCTMIALLAWIVGNACIFLLRRNGSKWRKSMDEQLNKSQPSAPASVSTRRRNSSLYNTTASGTAELGSTTILSRSSSSRSAARIWSSPTAYTPCTPWPWLSGVSPVSTAQLCTPTGVRRPSAIVSDWTVSIRFPCANPRAQSSAPSSDGSAPNTRMPVPWADSTVPASRPPPPHGVMMASRPPPGAVVRCGAVADAYSRAVGPAPEPTAAVCAFAAATCSCSSSPAVPCPRIMSGWSYGGTSRAPVAAITSAATASRSAAVDPLNTTRAPYPRVAATLGAAEIAGITMCAGSPAVRAASASAWAWLPELCVATPLANPPPASHPGSRLSRSTAWNAPRALKAPTRCMFSHLNQMRSVGRAGVAPSHGVPCSSSAVRGVDTMPSIVRLVKTGVRWTKGRMRLWASTTDARVSGGQVLRSAMADEEGGMEDIVEIERIVKLVARRGLGLFSLE